MTTMTNNAQDEIEEVSTARRKLTPDQSVALVESFYRDHGRLPKRGERSGTDLDVGNRLQYLRRRFGILPSDVQDRLMSIGVKPSQARTEHLIQNLKAVSSEITLHGFEEATKTNAVSEIAQAKHIGRFLLGLRKRISDTWTTNEARQTISMMENLALITVNHGCDGVIDLRPARGTLFAESMSGFVGQFIEVPTNGKIVSGVLVGIHHTDSEDGTNALHPLIVNPDSGERTSLTVHPLSLFRPTSKV